MGCLTIRRSVPCALAVCALFRRGAVPNPCATYHHNCRAAPRQSPSEIAFAALDLPPRSQRDGLTASKWIQATENPHERGIKVTLDNLDGEMEGDCQWIMIHSLEEKPTWRIQEIDTQTESLTDKGRRNLLDMIRLIGGLHNKSGKPC